MRRGSLYKRTWAEETVPIHLFAMPRTRSPIVHEELAVNPLKRNQACHQVCALKSLPRSNLILTHILRA